MSINNTNRKFYNPVTNKQTGKLKIPIHKLENTNPEHCLAHQNKQGEWVWN